MTQSQVPWENPGTLGYQGAPPRRRLNWLGVASAAAGALTGVGELIVIIIAGVMNSRPGGMDEKSPATAILGFCVLGGIGLALVGITLGFVGFFISGREKISPTLGVAFNGMIILGLVALVAIGLAIK